MHNKCVFLRAVLHVYYMYYISSNRYGMESNNGVSMTSSSGQPYNNHGTPRFPIRSDTVQNAHQYAANAMNSYANGHTLPTVHFTTTATQPGPQAPPSNGFQSVGLQAPQENGHMSSSPQPQPLPVQPIRPIQPVIFFNYSYAMLNSTHFPVSAKTLFNFGFGQNPNFAQNSFALFQIDI